MRATFQVLQQTAISEILRVVSLPTNIQSVEARPPAARCAM
jgi:hypothetical protein